MPAEKPLIVAQYTCGLETGGAERTGVNLANGLAELGVESHFICSRGEGPLKEAIAPDVKLFFAHRTKRWDLAGMKRIARYIDDNAIDLVHCHTATGSYLLKIVRWMCRRPPLVIFHDQRPQATTDQRMRRLDKMLLGHLAAYVAGSQQLVDRGRQLFKLPPERCVFMYNGTDIRPPRAPYAGPPTVVQVANVHVRKRQDVALAAAAIVRRAVPNLRWVFVGNFDPNGDYGRELLKQTDELGLKDCVTFAGCQIDVRSYLEQAHVGALTSDGEVFPMVMLEYMAESLPIVITDSGQVRAVMERAEAGEVTACGDVNGIAAAVERFLTDPEEARRFGENGRAFVERHYSVAAMTRAALALYRELLPTAVLPAAALSV